MASIDLAALAQAVRQKDYGAQLVARQGGADAVDALAPLLADADEEVRELAVHCMAETGDPRAGDALVQLTVDSDPQVAMAAARAMHRLGGARSVPALLAALPRSDEPLVRRELGMAIGRFAGPGKIPDLRERLAEEQSPVAHQGILAALARMGDDPSREAFAAALSETGGMARKPWLDLAEYIEQPWLITPLGVVLDDPTPVLRVGVDARPDLIQALRACDLAVVLIAKLGAATFSFPVTRAKNYSAEEISEVKRFAGAA
ncbi:HEAT repeat domain-containing protein [Pendulispora rubella]|uniref:HEAT repeat domain-containing protein n=1 Tax=Pendulispora rubella TaxID=2741070 RepID=A0ABZ2LIM3_9BACT